MGKRHLNNWRPRLPLLFLGLLLLASYAPLPKTLHAIFLFLALAAMMVYLPDSPESGGRSRTYCSRWRFWCPLLCCSR